MSTVKFVVSHMDEQMGPFDEQQLKAAWVKGEILPIDYVYDESKQDWILLAERFPWASQVQGEDIMPPPPTTSRSETVVARRLNQELAMKNSAPVATMPSPAATPVAPAAALTATVKPAAVAAPVAATASVHIPAPAAPVSSPAPAQAEHIRINSEPIQLSHVYRDAKLNMVDGVGELDLSALNPGKVELVLNDALKLTGQEPMQIHVKPAEPVSVTWTIVPFLVVGQELEIAIKAVDQNGRVCLAYSDQFTLKVTGEKSQDLVMKTTDGQARLKLHNEKAESWSLSLHYNGQKKLRLPETHALEWQAGPAARLMIDGNQEYVAGQPIKVMVKAVDAYGNVAKQFKGTVNLEVKAS